MELTAEIPATIQVCSSQFPDSPSFLISIERALTDEETDTLCHAFMAKNCQAIVAVNGHIAESAPAYFFASTHREPR